MDLKKGKRLCMGSKKSLLVHFFPQRAANFAAADPTPDQKKYQLPPGNLQSTEAGRRHKRCVGRI